MSDAAPPRPLTYAGAGVDVEAGEKAVALMQGAVARTRRPESLGGLCGFAGLFALDTNRWRRPVLAAATDGVGTKIAIARAMDRHDTIGIDLVAMVVDDIVVDLPSGSLPDTLITAAQSLDGVEVDSIRPFSGSVDRRGQIAMLAELSRHRGQPLRALGELVDGLPRTMTAGWALVLGNDAAGTRRVTASIAAPSACASSAAAGDGCGRT